MIGLNGKSFSGAFTKNTNASLPNTSFSYENYLEQQKSITVPQTVPQNITPSGIPYSIRMEGGIKTYYIQKQNSEWNDVEIMAPPDPVLAKMDIERQKARTKEIVNNLTDEQKELLRKLDDGELVSKPNLIEESKKS